MTTARMFDPDSPEERAKSRQDATLSAYEAMEARASGLRDFPVFLQMCLEERVWENKRTLSSGKTLDPVSFQDFISKPYPVGLGTSYEAIEAVIAGNEALSSAWEALTGRRVPKQGTVPVDSVKVPSERRRPLKEATVQKLADSIKLLGLLNPIDVTPDRVLVAGLHRLEACRRLGWTEIPVAIVELDDLRRQLAEIDENLVRNELTDLERSEHLQARMEIYEALHPETKHGASGGGHPKSRVAESAGLPPAPAFAEDTATKTGRSARVIREEVQIAKSLTQEERDAVRETPIAERKTDLLALAREKDPDQRAAIIEKVKSGEAKTVKEAKQALVPEPSQTRPTPQPDPSAWWTCPACSAEYNKQSAAARGWIKRGYCDDCEGESPELQPVPLTAIDRIIEAARALSDDEIVDLRARLAELLKERGHTC